MTHPKADIALLTDHRYAAKTASRDDWYLGNILRDDGLLQKALEERALTSVRIDWASPDVDWSAFRCAVFRTTWDYFERISEFTAWLNRIEPQVRLCNEAAIIWWNLDKHYLADLESRGVPVVATRFIEPGTAVSLTGLLEETGWDEAVLKPCVSGGARHTYRLNRASAGELQTAVQPLLAVESFLLQPFINDVVITGEDSLIVIDGQYTHAIRKVAKPGDFRVQDDHGGTVHDCRPEPEQIRLAEQAMAACNPVPAYGRVDMVRDNTGRWSVIELELIEPELWLRNHPPAATHLAEAIARVAGA
ncbi:MAG: ATP-grasp domain-containing protein [Cyclonatronaceae bacterium]